MKKKLCTILSILFLLSTTLVPSFSAFAQGTLTVDLSINPVNSTTLAGQDALYKMDFKVTGVQSVYTNSKIVISIPNGYELNTESTPLDQLKINEVVPVYSASSSTLTYNLGTISSGQLYSYVLKVKTKNGTTPNGTKIKLNTIFSADNLSGTYNDTAEVEIVSSNTINVTKTYIDTVNSANSPLKRAPLTNDFGLWNIKISSLSKKVGLQFLKEGTNITIIDTLPTGLSYVSDDSGYKATVSGQKVTWTIPAPTSKEQIAAIDTLFSKEIQVKTKFTSTKNFDTIKNSVSVSAIAIDNTAITNSSSYQIGMGVSSPSVPIVSGKYLLPQNIEAPTAGDFDDVQGTFISGNSATLALWDDDLWSTGIHVAPYLSASFTKAFTKYKVTYTPDSALYLESINTAKYYEKFDVNNGEKGPLVGAKHPVMDITLTINGTDYLFVSDAQEFEYYSVQRFLEEKGLSKTSRVSKIVYNYRYAPPGMNGRIFMTWSIKKGTTKQVRNTSLFEIEGYDQKDKANKWSNASEINNANVYHGVRWASVTARPAAAPPVASTSISLERQQNGVVNVGPNRVIGKFSNVISSTSNITKDMTSVVVLPSGVTVDASNPDFDLIDENGSESGVASILPDDGSGKQRLLIKWVNTPLMPGKTLEFSFNVNIGDSTESPMEIYVYSGSGNSSLAIPTTPNSITDSYLIQDTNDLNGNSNKSEMLVKSGNKYTVLTDSSLNVKKTVKGNLDTDYSSQGHVSPGGTIDYKISINNRNINQSIESFQFIDVLPSVGDLGITDNILRNSKFTPVLEGPIKIPDSLKNKVSIFYSKSKNPSRYSLYNKTLYPESTTKYSNPNGSENANWLTESEVTDWKSIHSYAVKLVSPWNSVSEINFNFSMRAPTVQELKANHEENILATNVVGDPSKIDESERTAWNSFAYRENYLQMIEPLKVGVSMTNYTGEIYLLKYINKNSSDATPKIDKDYQLVDEEGLRGAKFKLLDSDGKEVENVTATTDDKGQIHFKNVWFGDYSLVEIEAPEGYELYKKEIKVRVSPTENNGIAVAFAGDDPITKLPDAGGDGSTLIPVIIFASLSLVGLTGLGSLYLFRKKNEE